MTNNIELARRQLGAVDIAPHVAAIIAAKAERQRINVGIERGMAQMAELGREISAAREGKVVVADDAASALMSGTAILCRSEAELTTQRRGVEIGLRELRDQELIATEAESAAQSNAFTTLSDAVGPSAAAIENMAREGVAAIAAAYASAFAIASATGSSRHRTIADSLRNVLGIAIEADLAARVPIKVPAAIAEMLRAGEAAIGKLGRAVPEHVAAPDRLPDAFYMGLASVGAA